MKLRLGPDTPVDMPTICLYTDCKTRATYGPPGAREKLYCVTHKDADHVDVMNKRCRSDGCMKLPVYGPPGAKKGLYCATHKDADHVDVKAKRCQRDGCDKIPVYGPPGAKKGLYCVTHKGADHVDVAHKRCLGDGCMKRPNYGPPGAREKLYCVTHKGTDHVDVAHKRCLGDGCMKLPVYGPPGTKERLYCNTHKGADHVDVKAKRCQRDGCDKIPVYGPPGTKKGLYCSTHKGVDHVNVKTKRCQRDGCDKIPAYGPPGTKERLYCVTHKGADHVDVMNKRCLSSGCMKHARYGLPGTEPDRCREHVGTGMIIYPRKRCDSCLGLGIWGASAAAATRRCEAHRRPDDKNLVEGHCASCGLEAMRGKDGICRDCGEYVEVKRQFLTKQRAVKAALEAEFKIDSYDRMLDGGLCSRRRPDFVIDGTYRQIVIEVDEHQHQRSRDYSETCEHARMWDIAQALGMPTTFVRFNPDPYKDAAGQRRDPPASQRHKVLLGWVRALMERQPQPGCFASAMYLYYDGFGTPESAVDEALECPLGLGADPDALAPLVGTLSLQA